MTERTLLTELDEVAEEIFDRWDKDMRSGKLLTALGGRVEKYDPRVTRIRMALAAYDPALIAAAANRSTAGFGAEGVDDKYFIERVLRDVCELPDRTSPDDWPEAMLVTGEELSVILERHLEAFATPPRPGAEGVDQREGGEDALIAEMLEALKAVVAVADRKTVEFDKARAAIAKAESGAAPPGDRGGVASLSESFRKTAAEIDGAIPDDAAIDHTSLQVGIAEGYLLAAMHLEKVLTGAPPPLASSAEGQG